MKILMQKVKPQKKTITLEEVMDKILNLQKQIEELRMQPHYYPPVIVQNPQSPQVSQPNFPYITHYC